MKTRIAGSFLGGLCLIMLTLVILSTAGASPQAPTATWYDDFNSPALGPMWSWIREDTSHWSLTANPGYMRITTQPGSLLGSSNDAKNLLVADAPTGDFIIETRMLYEPAQNFQFAGLLVYEDDDNFMSFGRAFCSLPPPACVNGNGIYYDHEEQGSGVNGNFATSTTVTDEAYLLIRRLGNDYTGFASEDGASWVEIGTHTAISGMVPLKVGLFSAQGPEIPADFDYFRLFDYTGLNETLYIPVISKN